MKNIINYYYNFNITNLRNISENFYFNYKNNLYIFYLISYKVNINYTINLMNNIILDNNFHQILKNRNDEILTFDGTNYYVLMKVNIKYNRNINIIDLLLFSTIPLNIKNKGGNLKSQNWVEMWTKKIDYLEYYINNKESVSDEIKSCFNYFVGLGENAIEYVKKTLEGEKNVNIKMVISHNRISSNYTLYDLYNPLNLIIDYNSRDISEYLKELFYSKSYNDKKIIEIVDKINMNEFEYKMLYGRLLFPTFFFDLFDNVEIKNLNSNYLISIYNRAREYEIFLNIIFNRIRLKYNIPSIFWIKK